MGHAKAGSWGCCALHAGGIALCLFACSRGLSEAESTEVAGRDGETLDKGGSLDRAIDPGDPARNAGSNQGGRDNDLGGSGEQMAGQGGQVSDLRGPGGTEAMGLAPAALGGEMAVAGNPFGSSDAGLEPAGDGGSRGAISSSDGGAPNGDVSSNDVDAGAGKSPVAPDGSVGEEGGIGSDGGQTPIDSRNPGFVDDSYRPTSSWLTDPEANIDYVVRSAGFWFSARDESGGYFTNVEMDGTPSGSQHSPMTQSRNAYGFVRAFMVEGDESFLEHAQHALDFHYDQWLEEEGGWDALHGAFLEHYGLLGPGAMCEATRDPTHCAWFFKAEENLDNHLWDSDAASFGYYERGSRGWASPSGKSFNSTVDAVTTHELPGWLLAPDDRTIRLQELGSNMLTRLVGNLDLPASGWGFPEYFTTDWEPDPLSESQFVGHVFKTSWCLARLFLAFGQEEYRLGAQAALEDVLARVWDPSLPTLFVTPEGYPEWWELEEAYMAGMLNYYIAETAEKRGRYLEVADRAISAFHAEYDDLEFGETTKLPRNTEEEAVKGDYYKAAYHTTEFGYYALLYGQLLYRHQPVTLYYRIQPAAEPREIALYPVPLAKLRISSVTLEGSDFLGYDSERRVLELPAEVGGTFRVTFFLNDG